MEFYGDFLQGGHQAIPYRVNFYDAKELSGQNTIPLLAHRSFRFNASLGKMLTHYAKKVVGRGVSFLNTNAAVIVQHDIGSEGFLKAFGKGNLEFIGSWQGATASASFGAGLAAGLSGSVVLTGFAIVVPILFGIAGGILGGMLFAKLGDMVDRVTSQGRDTTDDAREGDDDKGTDDDHEPLLSSHDDLFPFRRDPPYVPEDGGGGPPPPRPFRSGDNGGGPPPSPRQVGGVLLDRAAACDLRGMSVECAYWDEDTQSLVLVSREGDTLKGPTLDGDHLHVALRAAFAGEPIGVSIDPPAEYRYRQGAVPPPGTPMYVSYLGFTRGTAFGAIMFEADRVLKCLTKGVDNETDRPRKVDVPGFRTLLERMCAAHDHSSGSWHRFWFVIDEVRLALDSASGMLRFGDVRLKVLSECEAVNDSGQTSVSACDREFAEHFSQHFERYAEQEPSLAGLKELARTTALAHYLVREALPVDLSSLFSRSPVLVDTPDQTPAIVASQELGAGHYLQLIGGVDLDAQPTIQEVDDPALRALRSDCENARNGASVRTWAVPSSTGSRVALAIPLGRPASPYTAISEDHQFTGSPLRSRRRYDSSGVSGGDFGRGWNLSVPYRLTPLKTNGKRQETQPKAENAHTVRPVLVLLHNGITGETVRYRLVKGHQRDEVYARVVRQYRTSEGISFSVAQRDTIQVDGDGFCLRRHDATYYFDPHGFLRRMEHSSEGLVHFDWQMARLATLSDEHGRGYRIVRDASGRVSRIECTDGSRLDYAYDSAGLLSSVRRNDASKGSYRYDQRSRLTEIRDGDGTVVRRVSYDGEGNASSGSDRVTSGTGAVLKRTFSGQRLSSVEDQYGWRVAYSYASSGAIESIDIADTRHRLLTLDYGGTGELRRVSDEANRRVDLAYEGGRLKEMIGSDGSRATFSAQPHEVSVTVEDNDGDRWDASFRHQRSEIVGPGGYRIRLLERKGRLLLSSPLGKCQIKSIDGRRTLRARERGGAAVDASFSQDGSVIQWRRSGPSQSYSEVKASERHTAVLKDPVGEVLWESNVQGTSIRMDVSWR